MLKIIPIKKKKHALDEKITIIRLHGSEWTKKGIFLAIKTSYLVKTDDLFFFKEFTTIVT